jgi:sulfur relay (sulfurtransferase) complex TusBCD TusD component (DsrE family)
LVNHEILALLLTSTPYGSQYADHMCWVALRAREKGYAVEILLYGREVLSQIGLNPPEGRFPFGATIAELIKKGAKVYGCDGWSSASVFGPERGPNGEYSHSQDIMEGIKMVPMSKLVEVMARADRVLSFGGG